MKYNKLVRDKIPEIIISNNEFPTTHIATNEEYFEKLKLKLKEEVNEFFEDKNPEELADILEVIYALSNSLNVSKEKLEEIRENKAKERGEFKEKIVLEEVK